MKMGGLKGCCKNTIMLYGMLFFYPHPDLPGFARFSAQIRKTGFTLPAGRSRGRSDKNTSSSPIFMFSKMGASCGHSREV
jgi:hypothetical protein